MRLIDQLPRTETVDLAVTAIEPLGIAKVDLTWTQFAIALHRNGFKQVSGGLFFLNETSLQPQGFDHFEAAMETRPNDPFNHPDAVIGPMVTYARSENNDAISMQVYQQIPGYQKSYGIWLPKE